MTEVLDDDGDDAGAGAGEKMRGSSRRGSQVVGGWRATERREKEEEGKRGRSIEVERRLTLNKTREEVGILEAAQLELNKWLCPTLASFFYLVPFFLRHIVSWILHLAQPCLECHKLI